MLEYNKVTDDKLEMFIATKNENKLFAYYKRLAKEWELRHPSRHPRRVYPFTKPTIGENHNG